MKTVIEKTRRIKLNKQEQRKQLIELIGDVHPFYVETIAETLYKKGYRQIDKNENAEVREETAKEILQTLIQYGDRDEALRRHILDMADEYGVEVEE